MALQELFPKAADKLPNAGIFMSGSGSNAEKLIQTVRALPHPPLNLAAIITDAPLTSRARELGRLYGITVVELDIRQFYLDRGETRVSIATEAGQNIREEWTNELRKLIAPLHLDFGVFAGFVPLTNITSDFPCLNVHPGDLTYLKEGRRVFVGLHTIPIERAIDAGLDYMRSSVIVVEPYSGNGGEMDSGLLLGLSPKVAIDFQGNDAASLAACLKNRPDKRPKGGYGDKLEEVARHNQDMLKVHGDWVVLPQVVLQFASGNYARDEKGQLYYRENGDFTPVLSVEFGEAGPLQTIR